MIGFVAIWGFITVWFTSVLITVAALPLYLLASISTPIKILAVYLLYRCIRPLEPWPEFQAFLGRTIRKYPYFCKQKLVFESDKAIPEPNSSTLLAVFPHGVVCMGWTVNLNLHESLQKSKITYLGATALFYTPFIRDILTWCSSGPASKLFMQDNMRNGCNLAILPGGFEEAAIFRENEYNVFLQERKGFLKYALEYGYRISPVFTFGEEATYSSLNIFPDIRLALARRRIPGIIFWSRFGPYPECNQGLTTVVGNPIILPKIKSPSAEEVDKYHQEFIMALRSLFDKYKTQYASDPNAKLTIH